MKCHQCDKPAIVIYGQEKGGLGLCLDCNAKFQQANDIMTRRHAEYMNFLASQIEMSLGFGSFMPRYHIQQPIIHKGELKLNNINITNSIVGAVNTGTVQAIDVSLSVIKQHGDAEIAEAIKELTEKVIQSIQLNDMQRNEILDQLSFISDQITRPKEQRANSLIKPIITAIGSTLAGITDVFTIWEKLKTLLWS